MRMKWKIIIPISGILSALIIITIVFSTIRFNRSIGNLFNERITIAANGLKKYISDREYDTKIASIMTAANTDIIKAIADHDTGKLRQLLNNNLDLAHVDIFLVTDETGRVLVRTYNDNQGDSVVNQRNIQEALKGNVYTCIEEGTYIKVSVRTGAPVYDSAGKLIGVVAAGVRFDTNHTLELLKEHYQADFSVIYNGTRIATTITRNGESMVNTPINPETASAIYSSRNEFFKNTDIMGTNYSAFFLPLQNDLGNVFAVISVAFSNAKFITERNMLQAEVISIGLVGLVVSIIMLLLISSKILKPVNELTDLVSEVTNGNMNIDIDRTIIAKDEIGLLTTDIYSLIDVIKSILSDLSQLTTDLNNFNNSDLQIDAAKYSGSYREIIDGIKKLADSISTMRKTMAAMDYLDTMISVVDFDYNLLYINRNMADTFKITKEPCLGKKCYKVIRNLDEPCPICQLPKLLPFRDVYPFNDYDNLFDETSGMYIGGRAAIIRWVDGVQVFFNSIRDETTKIKYQEQLRTAKTEAEAASVAKSSFLANMSHEIRTPMNSIVGFSELALDSEITPRTGEYLSMIKENADWLLQIINDILDISKIESGNIKLEYIPFELRGLLNSCNSIILPRAMEKNISLQFYAESIIDKQLIGDPTRLRQVLLNLLSNAVKFTDSGFVKLSVIQKYETEDSIILRFEIKDSGIGMTSDQISIIFEPFMQADVSTTRKYGGTGLGLSITKNLLELMGGQLDINTQPGIGTAIAFELKFAIADSSENPSAEIYSEEKFSGEKHSTKKHSAGKPKSKIVETADIAREIKKPLFDGEILVCEDNLVNQRVITEHLARVGLKTELAENGQEGIEKVRLRKEKGLKPFDLILMDIHMPVMDGIEATPKILELGTGTPIVAMTANVMSDDKELYKKAGIVDYVGKPFTSQELWRCLLRFLKPVDLAKVSDPKTANTENGDGSANLQKELETLFTKSHKNVCDEIKSAIAAGDIKTAHRLAHTIKSSAAQIGRTALSKAAAELEAALKDGKNKATETQMNALQYELSETLGTITQYPNEPKNQTPDEPSAIYDEVKARELIEKLESLLQTGNAECLTMIGELRAIPGSGEVIRQMEDFYFTAAEKALAELKTNLNL